MQEAIRPKIEVEFGDLPPFQHIAKGNRQAKGRARLLKLLKRKAVTMSKRVRSAMDGRRDGRRDGRSLTEAKRRASAL